MGIYSKLFKIYNDSIFQGNLNLNNYFEGWYFKMVPHDCSDTIAIIAGISLSDDSHSFIQCIDGVTRQTHYFRYPIESFKAHPKKFEVSIENNVFSENDVMVNTGDNNAMLKAELEFNNTVPYPSKLLSPGIMGWYSFVPRMECYHGVVSMDHSVDGSVNFNNKSINLHQGRGYIEKDYGTSFPTDWIWLQCNSFEEEGTSFMFSVARIPWSNSFFMGHLCFLRTPEKLYRFMTYTGARISSIDYREGNLTVIIEDRKYSLTIKVSGAGRGQLKAPVLGTMTRDIHESIMAEFELELTDRNNRKLFSSRGTNGGYEISGNIVVLVKNTLKE
jgi:tocopherol cyclase